MKIKKRTYTLLWELIHNRLNPDKRERSTANSWVPCGHYYSNTYGKFVDTYSDELSESIHIKLLRLHINEFCGDYEIVWDIPTFKYFWRRVPRIHINLPHILVVYYNREFKIIKLW
jgi:hypothetical protein